MARNIEIKARIDSVAALMPRAAALADAGPLVIAQDDTFFRCDAGRLKLRTFSASDGELIFYRRADARGPKESFYIRSPTASPESLRAALGLAWGEVGRVVKQRTLFLVGRTRVHLDRVAGLGDFLELEVVLENDESTEAGIRIAHGLMAALGIDASQLIEGAYVDVLAAKAECQPECRHPPDVMGESLVMVAPPSADSSMRAYYAARAIEYDAVYLKPERQDDLRAIERWLPQRFTGRHVLEIACGTGHWTRFIAAVAAGVVAIDAALETLEIAAGRVPADKVTLRAGDAYDLPRDVGPFDAAFAGFWFSHVPMDRRRAFLLGLNAVLAPGAKVVLLDNRFVAGSSSPVTAPDANGDAWQTRRLADGSTHRVLKNFPSEAELHAAIDGIGEHGTFTSWPYYWAFDYVATGADAATGTST